MAKSLITTIFKGVIGYMRAHPSGCPKASENTAWDGGAEVAAASVEDLKVMCTWFDSSAGDVKSSYKLPHHKQDGKHAVVLAGVTAAMAALNGARSAMKIPEADRRGVYGHLARHYKEFGQEVPVLKWAQPDEDAVIQDPLFLSVVFVADPVAEDVKKEMTTGLVISGFMSMKNQDRQGDVIEPKLFDLETYMKNPQLWVNHALWKDANGNGISVGITEAAYRARVKVNADNATADILNFDTGDKITTVETKDFVASDGDTGVWVSCRVMVPEVIDLIRTKRLNAFSWHGVLLRKANGVPFRMDLYEISLVNVPANQRAVFQIGKSVIVTYADGTCFEMNSTMKSEDGATSTEVEHQILCAFHAISGGDAKTAAFEKLGGGETEMAFTEKQAEELLASVGGLTDRLKALDTISEQLSAMDARLKALEEIKTKETIGDSPVPDAEKPATDVAGKLEEETPSADPPKKDEEPTVEEVAFTKQLAAITQALGVLPALAEDVKKFAVRLDAIEKAPTISKSITDSDGGDVDEASTQDAYRKLAPDVRKRVTKSALSQITVPDWVMNQA